MMCDNLIIKIINVIVFGITAYYTFAASANGMMVAMYWMAGGMLFDAIVDLIWHFIPNKKDCTK
ncbi:hypothetical protein PT281_02545 [Lactobacillus sp. ESL0701]|uniref:hypothetical protein n=1 Tax=Lactobacillus sp. ESL0701 TaxID=2983217 RepID=UPI0023FA255F|nr:hypothetical protein [Lactobacillus sp. ESL0701]MDF7672167.1 hypothetical protein [Lactobacillus sp. ESL0701]